MEQRERQVIDDLFGKLRQVEQQAPQRDPDAEQHIRQQLASQPAAPYYMAQAMLVQEQALGNLQGRVQELERQLAERPAAGGGGFLSGLFGGGPPQAQPPASRPAAPASGPFARQPYGGQQGSPMTQPGMGGPWGRSGGGGGGFLAGAMQTAVGVAGGVLVASALTSAFDGGGAEAASAIADETGLGGHEPAAAEEPAPDAQDGYQDAGYEQDPGFDQGAGDADLGGGFGEEV